MIRTGVVLEYRISRIHFLRNWVIASRIWSSKSQSRVSKSLAISNFKKIPRPLVFFNHETSLFTISGTSRIKGLDTKADCSLEIKQPMTSFNLLRKTLDKNLLIIPIKLIGLESLGVSNPFELGIKAMKDAIQPLPMILLVELRKKIKEIMLKQFPVTPYEAKVEPIRYRCFISITFP